MPVKVIDASALAAVLFGESAGTDITSRTHDAVLMAPTLLRYEIGSVGLKKMRRHPDLRDALIQALHVYDQLEIQDVEIQTLALVELAERENLTVYDAAYLWLARSLGAELVTLDTELQAAAAR